MLLKLNVNNDVPMFGYFVFCGSVAVLSNFQFLYSLFKCEELTKVVELQKKAMTSSKIYFCSPKKSVVSTSSSSRRGVYSGKSRPSVGFSGKRRGAIMIILSKIWDRY